MQSLYRPGNSFLHRIPAGAKLALLVFWGCALAFATPARETWVLLLLFGGAGLFLVISYLGARFKLSTLFQQLWDLKWLAVIVLVPQIVFLSIEVAIINTSRVVLLVLLAGLITMLTPLGNLLAVLEKLFVPLRFLGVQTEKLSLLLTLVITIVPVMHELFMQVRTAAKIRGAKSISAVMLPFLVVVMKFADDLGQALKARGVH